VIVTVPSPSPKLSTAFSTRFSTMRRSITASERTGGSDSANAVDTTSPARSRTLAATSRTTVFTSQAACSYRGVRRA
jgi:hypothetical protein